MRLRQHEHGTLFSFSQKIHVVNFFVKKNESSALPEALFHGQTQDRVTQQGDANIGSVCP
jgi:hypothetical protein